MLVSAKAARLEVSRAKKNLVFSGCSKCSILPLLCSHSYRSPSPLLRSRSVPAGRQCGRRWGAAAPRGRAREAPLARIGGAGAVLPASCPGMLSRDRSVPRRPRAWRRPRKPGAPGALRRLSGRAALPVPGRPGGAENTSAPQGK